MGHTMRSASGCFDELRIASQDRQDFLDTARVLKELSVECGLTSAPVLEQFAQYGVGAALDLLCRSSGSNVSGAYLRHRARWRAKRWEGVSVH